MISTDTLPRTFISTVTAVRRLTPSIARITFGGDGLRDFAPLGPDQFMYVLLPPPGSDRLTIDESFSWEHYQQMPADLRPVGAYYTVRRHLPETGEIEMDFVLHDAGHADGSHAARWAASAAVGASAALWGPRITFDPPTDTRWLLLVADDTGLPAVASILESQPAHTFVHAFVEVDGPDDHQILPSSANVHVTWLHRNGAAAGTTPNLLVDAVREMHWPSGSGYAWGGGESRAVTLVRRHVRHERDMPRELVAIVPYWRHAAHAEDVREVD